jgi:hypothetical protein
MKNFSKQDLQNKGKAIADKHQATKLYATSDGQFFLPEKRNSAELHKKSAKVELYELAYPEVIIPKTPIKK